MDERYSRLERHTNLYISNDDHKFVMYFYYIIFPLVTIISLFFLSTINVKATTERIITNYVTPGQACSIPSNQMANHVGEICALSPNAAVNNAEPLEIYPSAMAFGYSNIYGFQFYTNIPVQGYSYYTIKILGSNFANVPYTCILSSFGSSCKVVYVSSTRLNVNFTSNISSTTNQLQVDIRSSNSGNIATSGAWKINYISYLQNDMGDDDIINSGGTPPSSSGTSATNQDIIDSNTDNTNNIINNDNENTQTIVQSITNNILQTIDVLKDGFDTCYRNYFDVYKVGSHSDSTGTVERTGSRIKVVTIDGVHDNVSSGKTLKTLAPNLVVGETYYLSYTSSNVKGYIYLSGSNIIWSNNTNRIISQSDLDSIVIFYANGKNTTGYYDNFMIQNSAKPIANHFIEFGESCTSKLDTIYNSQNETNDLLKDDSIDQSQADSFFSDFDTADNGGISGIVTKPMAIIDNLLSNNSSCANLTLPSFMGVDNAYLPSGCILWNNAPSSVITIWNTLIVGLGSYFILKSLFNDVQKLKDPNDDRVDVVDL